MRTYVFYHRNCTDGFGAAWAARHVLGDQVRYVPRQPGTPFPYDIRDGSRVYLLDLGLDREGLLELEQRMREVTVIDHHASWVGVIDDLPFVTLDTGRAACVLAWRHFMGEEADVPALLRHIEDRDLWNWELEGSRAVNAALGTYPQEFDVWDDLTVEQLRHEGVPVVRHIEQTVASIAEQARTVTICGHEVPAANATAHASEVGHRLLETHPDAPFAAVYWETKTGDRRWSLRSRGDVDVGRIAAALGGGGHVAAAGFREKGAARATGVSSASVAEVR